MGERSAPDLGGRLRVAGLRPAGRARACPERGRRGARPYVDRAHSELEVAPPAAARRGRLSASPADSKPTMPRRFSQAAWFNAGSEPTRSRIMFQAAILSAPSGGGPMARETEHCGQKQIRWAEDFCRGRMPTVCANMYTATDLCPNSSSRLQRRQYKFSKGPFLAAVRPKENTVVPPLWDAST